MDKRGEGRGERGEGRGERGEGRGERGEGRGQRAEGRGQRAEGRGQRGAGSGERRLDTACTISISIIHLVLGCTLKVRRVRKKGNGSDERSYGVGECRDYFL